MGPSRLPVRRDGGSHALSALMFAAAALPDLVATPAQAVELEDTRVQFGHYEEKPVQFWPGPDGSLRAPSPLRVDTARASTGLKLAERTRLGIELTQDTWSGATPYITAPVGFVTMTGASAFVAADKAAAAARVDRRTLAPLNLSGTPLVRRDQVVNLMTSASPETRNQLRLGLDREWDDFALGVNLRLSDEPDYRAASIGFSGRWDFDQKRSTVTAGLSRTASRIDASLGPPSPYVDYGLYTAGGGNARIDTLDGPGIVGGIASARAPTLHFRGDRDDVAFNVGYTRVLNKNATFGAGLGYARSTGFLESPHKLVLMGFANPATPPVFNYLFTTLFAVPEKRPDRREQATLNLRWSQYVPATDGALHVDYSHSRDDWSIRADSLEAKWMQPIGERWTITPRIRYYTQTAADFYRSYFVFRQAYPQLAANPGMLDFARMPVDHWSSDQRLSGYGSRSLGIVAAMQLARDMRLEFGYEDYLRAGKLKWGGGGEESFADIRARMINVALSIDLQSRPSTMTHADAHSHHAHHAEAAPHLGVDAPAGVMHAHMLGRAGEFMLGYSTMHARQRGSMRHGTATASDSAVLASCGTPGCPTAPHEMTMHMHMLHAMYAISDEINVMVMPQFVSMRMRNRMLNGGFYTPAGGHTHSDMDLSGHASGGVGDTVFGVIFSLWRTGSTSIHATAGISAPTGSISQKMASHGNELQDYGMQLGSGTWDLLPGLTYTAGAGAWSWGAQGSGILRTGGVNRQGYKLGHAAQLTAWVGRSLAGRLSGSLRIQHGTQGAVSGTLRGATAVVDAFGNVSYPRPQHGPADIASNYGGQATDIGLGLSYALNGRERHGERIALEWIAPVHSRVNGYQLERSGTLMLNWNLMF